MRYISIIVITLVLTGCSSTVNVIDTDDEKVKIIAHRGDSGYAPEHTLAAYELARDAGADYIELDLGMTRDRKLIAIHDNTVNRTTNGSGKVNSLTLAQIKQLDAGSWFNKEYPDKAKQVYSKMKVPSLEEVINHFGTSVNYYIEIKTPNEYPGMTDILLSVLKRHHLIGEKGNRDKVIIESFSSDSLRFIHKNYPSVVLIQLANSSKDVDLENIAKYANGVGPKYSTLEKGFVENAHKKGLLVHCWTVDSELDIKKMKSWGVDGIFTDYVDKAKSK